MISTREFSEQLALDCFNDTFTADTGNPKKNLSLMRSTRKRQSLLAVNFIFPIPLLIPRKVELFTTPLSIVIYCQPLLLWILPLVLSILPKKKELRREEYITVQLEVTVTEGYLI